eukprot:6184009-Pleurochrysis_carterae.AAC.7
MRAACVSALASGAFRGQKGSGYGHDQNETRQGVRLFGRSCGFGGGRGPARRDWQQAARASRTAAPRRPAPRR